jgi:hypothetical protein
MDAGQYLEHHGLSGAVLPDEPDNFVALDLK